MLKLAAAFLMIFTISAHASDARILGKWISVQPYLQNKAVTVRLGFDFKADNTADMSTICEYPSKQLEAIVNVPVDVSEGKIKVLGSGIQTVGQRTMECTGSVDPGVTNYTIQGDTLRVSADGMYMDFVRRKN